MHPDFEENVELDAQMVRAGMLYGSDGVIAAAMAAGLPDVDTAVARAEWLKSKSQSYIDQVSNRVIDLARNGQ